MFKVQLSCIKCCYTTTCIKFKVHQVFNIKVPMLQKKYPSYYILEYLIFNIHYSLLIKKFIKFQNNFFCLMVGQLVNLFASFSLHASLLSPLWFDTNPIPRCHQPHIDALVKCPSRVEQVCHLSKLLFHQYIFLRYLFL